MADSYIAIDEPAVTDKKLDTEQITVGVNTVERERVRVAGVGATDLAGVDSTNGLDVDVTRLPAPLTVTGGGVEASALRVTIASDSTGVVSVDDNGASLTVDGTVGVSGTVTVDSELTTADLDTGAGTDTRAVVGLVLAASGGGLLVGAANPVPVSDNGTTLSIDDGAGSLTVDGTGLGVVGNAAHDAAVSGNPVLLAGEARTSEGTAVANGDTCRIATNSVGYLITNPHAPAGATWNYAAASGGIVNTTGVTAKAAAGAGVRNYVTSCQVVNGHATVSTDVQIRDGAAGTVLWRGFAQAAGGGVSCDFDPPLRGTANTLIEVACGTTGTATYFNLQGYTSAE